MKWLKFVNVFFLQWFFIRLARVVNDEGKTISYTFIRWVVPFTGWWSDYIYLNFKRK